MDNRFYATVLKEIKPLLDSQGFKEDNGIFKNDTKAVKVEYNEEQQMYQLWLADVSEGEIDNFSLITSWLFDDSQTESDAQSVGIDFAGDIRKNLGVKVQRAATSGVELPSASKSGAMTITGFAKKMLDIYPVLKDGYKEHIAKYGNFLYLDFFGKNLVPCLKETFTKGTKKQINKLYDVLKNAYIEGDKDTVNCLIAVLVAAAYNDTAVDESIKNMLVLNENTHFLASYENFKGTFKGNKKLLTAFGL